LFLRILREGARYRIFNTMALL